MGLVWVDPSPGNSCPTCKHFTGRTFPDGGELPLPAHPGCECFYMVSDGAGTAVDWDEEPGFARQTYIYYAAWLLREGRELPPVLEPLRAEAEAHNEKREGEGGLTPTLALPLRGGGEWKETGGLTPTLALPLRGGGEWKEMGGLTPTLALPLRGGGEWKEKNGMSEFRFNVYARPGRVDRDGHIIYGVSAAQGGVEALGHRMLLDGKTIEQIVQLGAAKAKGVKSRFAHPGLSSNGMGKFLGRLHNWRQEGQKATADLHLSDLAAKSPEGDLRTYTEELAEKEPDMFGMSIVFNGRRVWIKADGRRLTRIDRNGRLMPRLKCRWYGWIN